jgi:hypothetical protein
MLCDRCDQPLIEIDRYGELLERRQERVYCRGDKSAFIVELSSENIQALRKAQRKR